MDTGIENLVVSALRDPVDPPDRTISRTNRLIDLGMDGDDFSFCFVLDLEDRLGVATRQEEWDRVSTVQDAIDLFVRAVREHDARTG